MDRGAWQAIVHEVIESDTVEQLTLFTFNIKFRRGALNKCGVLIKKREM